MLDESFPHQLTLKPMEVLVEGEKVPALAYLAKQVDDGAAISAAYEKRMLDLVETLGEPIRSNFREHTYRADGAPAYRDLPQEGQPPEAASAAPPDETS